MIRRSGLGEPEYTAVMYHDAIDKFFVPAERHTATVAKFEQTATTVPCFPGRYTNRVTNDELSGGLHQGYQTLTNFRSERNRERSFKPY